jgi:signal peptidase I
MAGDRILVNKFAYQFWEPERWDVIVFKNPGNAKQNYIKRLIGLPGETIRVHCGDIYTKGAGDQEFRIARKSPGKLLRLLRLVHDTHHVPSDLPEANWPAAWRGVNLGGNGWKPSDDQSTYTLANATSEAAWLHYEHAIPLADQWLPAGSLVPNAHPVPRLITDFSGYNAPVEVQPDGAGGAALAPSFKDGYHWVGDLAATFDLEIQSDNGEVLLQLVEGGAIFTCTIEVATGEATCTLPSSVKLESAGGANDDGGGQQLTAATKVRGAGSYELRWANVDDQLTLWVNGNVVDWKTSDGQPHDGSYLAPAGVAPAWSESDPGDLHPARLGITNSAATLTRIRLSRDLYYIAMNQDTPRLSVAPKDYNYRYSEAEIQQLFASPQDWSETRLFDTRRYVEFQLDEDQFFPMGDNSPVSQDARLWSAGLQSLFSADGSSYPPPYIEREELIGKAFLVYWPHLWWKAGFPIPNVERMGSIR